MVVMDCGAEYHGYSADITRTIPISGVFTPEQRVIYDLVSSAQDSAITLCVAGKDLRDPHRRAVEIISAGLVKLGIIKSPGEYRKYFMHGTSHFLGMDVHDVGRPGALKPGMVMTVEPGIYIAAGSDCDKKWWNIGVRIEDDILITDGAPVNLSGALPRTSSAIEALMRSGE
jgi:Xaa-Pro aminopeptidase